MHAESTVRRPLFFRRFLTIPYFCVYAEFSTGDREAVTGLSPATYVIIALLLAALLAAVVYWGSKKA